MPRTLLVDAVGSCIAIDLADLTEDDAAAVRDAWVDAIANPAGEPVATVTPSGGDRAEMLSILSQQVTLAAIEAARGRAWMLHAAGIANPNGQVVVLVGPSGRGKTTASRALGAVYGYVSDETVAIDEDGRVWPYRKPLSVIQHRRAPKTQLAPSAVGLRRLPDTELRVAAIVVLDRDERHAGLPVVEVTDLGDALGELIAQTSFLHHQPAPLRFIAALAAATGGIRTVRYREAATLPAVMARLMADARGTIELPPIPTHVTPDSEPASYGPRFSRVPVADEVALDDPDRIALLTVREDRRGHVTVLGGIAPAVWRAAADATISQLIDAAVSAYGEPERVDAASAVFIAVGHLLDAHLLTSDEPLLARRGGITRVVEDERIAGLLAKGGPDEERTPRTDLTGSVANVWTWLERPITLTQLSARAIEAASGDDAAKVAAQVQAFVAQLTESGLVSTESRAVER